MHRRTPFDIARCRALADCASPELLAKAVTALLAPTGVEHWHYRVGTSQDGAEVEPLRIGNFPQAWVERYAAMGYARIDPMVAHCHDHITPLPWHIARARQAVPGQVARMFLEARAFGLAEGVSVPLHGPGPVQGALSFATHTLTAEIIDLRTPDLHLLALHVHEAARRHVPPLSAPKPVLTPRERECLAWAAQGRTSREIGRLLGVTERTTIFHLQNAAQKLGVNGRQAAIARGISLGLIVPPTPTVAPPRPHRPTSVAIRPVSNRAVSTRPAPAIAAPSGTVSSRF